MSELIEILLNNNIKFIIENELVIIVVIGGYITLRALKKFFDRLNELMSDTDKLKDDMDNMTKKVDHIDKTVHKIKGSYSFIENYILNKEKKNEK